MKKTSKILSAGAITAFSLSLALGLSANVDQGSQQQGAPLQGVHPPTQYGTPGEREAGHHSAGVAVQPQHDPAQEPQRFDNLGDNRRAQAGQDRQFQQQRATQQERRQLDQQTQQLGEQTEQFAQQAQGKSHKASSLLEKRVENQEGERLGSVEDLIIDTNTGQLEFVVVSAGGILGLGGDLRAIPPEALQVSDEDRVVLDITSDRWEQAPTFERDQIARLGEEAQAREIYSYYEQDYAGRQRGQQQFGARQQQETQEWGAQQQRDGSQQQWSSEAGQQPEAQGEWRTEQSEPASSHGDPAQNWQERHRTAEPHRLPGDPYGSPAEPSVIQPDERGVQQNIQQESHLRREEAGTRDSAGTEWRARAFGEELEGQATDRQSEQTMFGAREDRQAEAKTDRWEQQQAVDDSGPVLRNPRFHYSARTNKDPQDVASISMREDRSDDRVYGQPQYRLEAEQQESREFGAAPRREGSQQWQQSETQQRQQMQQQTQQSGQGQQQQWQAASSGQANLKMASDLMGKSVTDQQQESIGEISDFLVDLQSGQIKHTIVTAEGSGNERYAVPVRSLQIDQQGDRVTLQADRQQLQQAPRYEQQAASQRGDQIYRYEEQGKSREFGAPVRTEPQDTQAVEPEGDAGLLRGEESSDATAVEPSDEAAAEQQEVTTFGASERPDEEETAAEEEAVEATEDDEASSQ